MNTSLVPAALITGFTMLAGIAGVSLPMLLVSAKTGHEEANIKANAEKDKYQKLYNELQIKAKEIEISGKAVKANSDKLAQDQFALKKAQADLEDEKAAYQFKLNQEHRQKMQDVHVDQVAAKEAKEKAEKIKSDAEAMFAEARKTLEQAQKTLQKNTEDMDAVKTHVNDIKYKVSVMTKHIDNFEKTSDPYFLGIVEKRINENFMPLVESIREAKHLNQVIKDDQLNGLIANAEKVVSQAKRKSQFYKTFKQ